MSSLALPVQLRLSVRNTTQRIIRQELASTARCSERKHCEDKELLSVLLAKHCCAEGLLTVVQTMHEPYCPFAASGMCRCVMSNRSSSLTLQSCVHLCFIVLGLLLSSLRKRPLNNDEWKPADSTHLNKPLCSPTHALPRTNATRIDVVCEATPTRSCDLSPTC